MINYNDNLNDIAQLTVDLNLQEKFVYGKKLTLLGFKSKLKRVDICDGDTRVASFIPDNAYSLVVCKQVLKLRAMANVVEELNEEYGERGERLTGDDCVF